MAANCNYKVKLIGALDMLRFKNMPKVREAAIQAAPATPLPKTFTTNEKAKVRHPEMQRVVVAEIRPNGPDVKTIVLKSEDGAPLAPFRAGQYVSDRAHRRNGHDPRLLAQRQPCMGEARRIQHRRTARPERLCFPVGTGYVAGRAEAHDLRAAGPALL